MGDHVLIECTNTVAAATPPSTKASVSTTYKVIGFKDHPKSCEVTLVYLYTVSHCYIWDMRNNMPYNKVEYNDSTVEVPHYVASGEWPVLQSLVSTWLNEKVNNAPSQSAILTPELVGRNTHLLNLGYNYEQAITFPLQTWLPNDKYEYNPVPGTSNYTLYLLTHDINQPPQSYTSDSFHSRQYLYASRFVNMDGVRRWNYCITDHYQWYTYGVDSGYIINYKIFIPYHGEQVVWQELNETGSSNEVDFGVVDFVSYFKHEHLNISTDQQLLAINMIKWTPMHGDYSGGDWSYSYGTDEIKIWASYKILDDTSVVDPVETLKTVGKITSFETAITALMVASGARYTGFLSAMIL